jgi:hypothetical protein
MSPPLIFSQLNMLCSNAGLEVLAAVVMKSVYYILEYSAVPSVEREPNFRRSMLFVASACHLLHNGYLHGLLFDPENGRDIFLRNIGWLSTDYALYISEDIILYNIYKTVIGITTLRPCVC